MVESEKPRSMDDVEVQRLVKQHNELLQKVDDAHPLHHFFDDFNKAAKKNPELSHALEEIQQQLPFRYELGAALNGQPLTSQQYEYAFEQLSHLREVSNNFRVHSSAEFVYNSARSMLHRLEDPEQYLQYAKAINALNKFDDAALQKVGALGLVDAEAILVFDRGAVDPDYHQGLTIVRAYKLFGIESGNEDEAQFLNTIESTFSKFLAGNKSQIPPLLPKKEYEQLLQDMQGKSSKIQNQLAHDFITHVVAGDYGQAWVSIPEYSGLIPKSLAEEINAAPTAAAKRQALEEGLGEIDQLYQGKEVARYNIKLPSDAEKNGLAEPHASVLAENVRFATEYQIAKLAVQLDRDGDGKVTETEIAAYQREAELRGFMPKADGLTFLASATKQAPDGAVTLTEAQLLGERMSAGQLGEPYRNKGGSFVRAAKEADIDGDGVVSRNELSVSNKQDALFTMLLQNGGFKLPADGSLPLMDMAHAMSEAASMQNIGNAQASTLKTH